MKTVAAELYYYITYYYIMYLYRVVINQARSLITDYSVFLSLVYLNSNLRNF